jgi:alkylated DNA nucleotide flippase Atl1
MRVNDDTIKGLIEGQKQFEVPIWQRQYTWGSREHKQLWQDLLEQHRHMAMGTPPSTGHFFGSVVLSPRDPAATGISHFLVIDGQQRLTTVMLLLCAIRDALADGEGQAVQRYNNLYLQNQYAGGNERFRLLPTEEDRTSFLRWVQGHPDNGAGDLVSDAYRFYRGRIEEVTGGGDNFNLEQLATAAVDRLEIVEITTQEGDNVHRIFQSLNGTGVALDQADLLRNHLFMLLPTRGEEIYEQVWRPMEQEVGVENLEGLARVDLMRRGEVVAYDRVYEEHQRLLTPIAGDEAAVEERVRDLALRGSFYKRLIDPSTETHGETSAGLQRLARWGAQTSYPVLMLAFDLRHRGVLSDDDVARAVSLIESFLVRRQLARIPTNALNRLFVQLISRFPEDKGFVDTLHRELSRDRLYWPSDNAIRTAVRTQPFFHIGRGHQRKMILERLERSFEHPEIVDFQSVELQVEHVMPQSLSSEWREHLESLGQDPDEVHDELVHTLGNLTLTAFNGTLSNNPFERKRQIYDASHLELNRALAENESWGRDQILARADVLAEQVAEVWPAPLPGITSESDGFDWSRIEAAIRAIPAGRWTSYGDLAEVGGTAAMPVGQHVAQMPAEANAYRVLSADGSVREEFAWTDPNDTRDVHEVLAAEGIEFDEAQRASDSQRMPAEELAGLVENPEDQAGEETGLNQGVAAPAKSANKGRPAKAAPTKAQVAGVASMRRNGATWDEVIAGTGIRTNSTGFRILLEEHGFDKFGREGGRGPIKAKGWGSAGDRG